MCEEIYTNDPPATPANGPGLRIYSNPICPFAQRARIVVAHLNVPHEIVNVHLKRKPEWYIAKINPHGQVPVVQHNGHLIRESAIAFDYVDDVFNKGALWQSDPLIKAQAKLLLNDYGNKFIPNYYKHYSGSATAETDAELAKFITRMEQSITAHGGKYLFGDLSAVDLLVWPWIERIEPALIAFPDLAKSVSKDKQPVFFAYIERMKQIDAVKKTLLSVESHLKFYASMKEGNPDQSGGTAGVKLYASKPQ